MKKISATLAALSLALAPTIVPMQAVQAQAYVPTYACQADSNTARGVWVTTDLNLACYRALQECAKRTPYGMLCTVTRWWIAY